ncbi:MAG: hypothetical protein EOP05_04285 [Proteobacteria bacterium]|nr:MAG: hypothetical protein EOP05_04285 [Pseudomonadota bacterium]
MSSDSLKRDYRSRQSSDSTTPGRKRFAERLPKDHDRTESYGYRNEFFEKQIDPVWASTKVAAKILDISPNALRIMKCRGKVECRYFGKHLRFEISQLQLLLRKNR